MNNCSYAYAVGKLEERWRTLLSVILLYSVVNFVSPSWTYAVLSVFSFLFFWHKFCEMVI